MGIGELALTTRPLGRLGSTQNPLLSRVPSSLSFQGSWVAWGSALLATLGCLPCKSHLCHLPLNAAPVVDSVVTPAAKMLRLSPRGRTSSREVEAHTCDSPWCVSEVTLHVVKMLAALALQWAFGPTYDSVTCSPLSLVNDHTFGTSGPRASEIIK